MGPRVMADPRHHGCFNQKLVGGLEHLDYFSIQLGMSSSQLTIRPSFFRGVGQPPTRISLDWFKGKFTGNPYI